MNSARRTTRRLCCLIVVCALCASIQVVQAQELPSSTPETAAISPAQREAHWREDLEFLTAKLSAGGHTVDLKRGISSRGQLDFDKVYPTLKQDVAALESDVPNLSDGEMILRLMKIVASAHIAHNRVVPPLSSGFVSRVPLSFQWFSDGLAVSAASADYRAALGARVLTMGGKTPEEVLASIAPYVSQNNETQLRVDSLDLLRLRIMLRRAGALDESRNLALTLQKPGAAPFALTVPTSTHIEPLLSMYDAPSAPHPLWLSHAPTEHYWYQYLSDSRTLFVQYNSCENDPKLPFKDLAAKVLADLHSQPVERVVIDMRLNGGGDSRVINPLMDGLAGWKGKSGGLFVLIGRYTFSSALDNAATLHDRLHATLVGESTSGARSGYGEVKVAVLPNSKLQIRFTSKWWGSHEKAEQDVLVPDIPAPLSLADALAGRDPVLAAAVDAEYTDLISYIWAVFTSESV